MIPRLLAGVEESIIALLLAAMTLLVIVEVILRYGFSSGLLWIQELTLLLAAWLVLTGAGAGNKKAPAAPMVVVMDASDTPDVNSMAAAMKRILPSISVVWKGEAKK